MTTKKPKAVKCWAIVDIQQPNTRWAYRVVAGKKSGMAIYFTKPIIPNGWRRKKRIIRVLVTPL